MISISFRKKEEELVNFDYQSEILFVRAIITSTAGARFVFLPSYRTRFSTRQSARVLFRTVFLNTFSLFPQCQSLQTYYFNCIPPKMSEVFFTYASFYFTMVFTFLEFLVIVYFVLLKHCLHQTKDCLVIMNMIEASTWIRIGQWIHVYDVKSCFAHGWQGVGVEEGDSLKWENEKIFCLRALPDVTTLRLSLFFY